jgi:hypothetical protein
MQRSKSSSPTFHLLLQKIRSPVMYTHTHTHTHTTHHTHIYIYVSRVQIIPKIYKPLQNCTAQKGETKQAPYWRPTNIRRRRKRLAVPASWCLKFVHPWHICYMNKLLHIFMYRPFIFIVYYLLFVPTNAHTHTHTHTHIKILNYIINAPTCFSFLHHLQGALILRLLKL